ncbi:hypothetical protein [uncultured Thiothrix sp.]|uniref:hypothetical protein n=1 Tax=uncultured Thiothrix sp. TaxID=223185 RepID=UPI00260DEBB0|nr:hypothetical protein [uncultured Thiothrix sp.]
MKRYFLLTFVLLAGCEDKNFHTTSPPPLNTVSTANTLPAKSSLPQAELSSNVALLNQHQQENTSIYPRNDLQLAVDQSLKTITAPIQQDLLDIMGTELQSIDTQFNEQHITFQYQVWKIKHQSVCIQAQLNAMQFSECTQAAKALFQTMCNELPNTHPRNQQLKRMYCQAAIDFKPTIAQISRSQADNTDKVQRLRTSCNDLIFKAKISESASDERARDQACQKYKKAAKIN